MKRVVRKCHSFFCILKFINKTYESFIIFFIFCCSFNEKKASVVEYIIFGTYCGECTEHCATMYRVDSTSIQIDTSNNFMYSHVGNTNTLYTFTGYNFDVGISRKEFFDKINKGLPDEFIENTEKIYGEPDAHDQCGIYVEVKSDGRIRKFYIDTDEEEVPDEINYFLTILYKNIEK